MGNVKARNLLLWPPLPWGNGGQDYFKKGIKKDFYFSPFHSLFLDKCVVNLCRLTRSVLVTSCA